MDVLDEELLNFWKTMDTWKVQYIMVGGFATNLHGFSRMTADLDIWIKDTPDNRKSFRATLSACGLGDYPEIETMPSTTKLTTFHFKKGFELDVMTDLKGFKNVEFDSCLQAASVAEIEGVFVPFLLTCPLCFF